MTRGAPMIGRRRFSMLTGAALMAPLAFATAASAKARRRLLPHDMKAAQTEFARIVAMFNEGDLQAFLAYGPPGVIADKRKLSPEQIPEFLIQRTHNAGRKDNVPIKIDSFARMYRIFDRVIYYSSLTRSAFFEEQCETEGYCTPEGYGPMYEHWRVYFDGPRIRMLEQILVLA